MSKALISGNTKGYIFQGVNMRKNILYSLLSFLMITPIIFTYSNVIAAEADSTNITPGHYPTLLKVGYILYQSAPINVTDAQSANAANGYVTPSSLKCPSGYAACVSVQLINYNYFNPSKCDLHQFFLQPGISWGFPLFGITSGYVVWLNFSARQSGDSSCGSGGSDGYYKGGYFSYTIMCIPRNNVDSSAFTDSSGTGPVCT